MMRTECTSGDFLRAMTGAVTVMLPPLDDRGMSVGRCPGRK
jgi:hypothetical protein